MLGFGLGNGKAMVAEISNLLAQQRLMGKDEEVNLMKGLRASA